MSTEQVARVYAQALVDAAREAGVVEPVRRDLGEFVKALATSASLRDVLADPQIEMAAKERVLVELTRGGQSLLGNTLQILLGRGRFAVVPDLYSAYDALAADDAGVVEVEVVSAIELTPDVEKQIADRVNEATGRRAELVPRVDPGIVGGLVLRVGDVIVDASVRARIRQLRRRLVTAEVRGDV